MRKIIPPLYHSILFSIISTILLFSYQSHATSLIEWSDIDQGNWGDFNLWAKERALKDDTPYWRDSIRQNKRHEIMGRVLSCHGGCTIQTSGPIFQVRPLSRILEGDELVTDENSYAWVILVDGSLVRLSPKTALSFNEIDIAKNQFFIHARLGQGNIYWLTRIPTLFKQQDGLVTDSLFRHFPFQEKKFMSKKNHVSEENYVELLDESEDPAHALLKDLISKNNEFIQEKATHTLLTFPNGSILGTNMKLDVLYEPAGKAYVQNRSNSTLYMDGGDESSVGFYFRGHENKEVSQLQDDQVYEISVDGRELNPVDGLKLFNVNRLLTSRINPILINRELMLDQYSKYLYASDTKTEDLDLMHGYRLWNEKEENEIQQRISFLLEYTRRMETTHLMNVLKLKERMQARGEISPETEDQAIYYEKALKTYLHALEKN